MQPPDALRRAFDPGAALPWACVAAGFAWFAGLALRHPTGDGDLLWQRWLGATILRSGTIPRSLGDETFTAPGAPWTPQEWLFSLALATTDARGLSWLVPLVCALAATLALAIVIVRCRQRGVSPILAAAASLLCTLATLQSFGVRAQVVAWAGISFALWLVEREDVWSYAVIPLTVIWANLHASVFLVPVVAGIAAFAIVVRERRWSPAVRRAVTIAVASCIATLATPLGVALPRYALMLLASPIRHSINEWGPTSAANAAFVLGALPLILILAFFGARTSLRDRLVVATFLIALFGAIRNVPIFAFAVAPLALGGVPRRSVARAHGASWATLATTAAAAALLGTLAWRIGPAQGDPLPSGPARALLATTTAPRVFCEDFAWCSLFLGAPGGVRVFLDGRCDPYPESVWRDYRTLLDANTGWSSVLAAHRVDAVLTRRDGALDSLLAGNGGWRAVASDRRSRLYVRATLTARR